MNGTPHHIGYLAIDIDSSIAHWETFGYKLSGPQFDIPEQKVKVCFLKHERSDLLLELVQPYSENTPLQRLATKGTLYYHVGLKVADINAEMEALNVKGYQLVSEFLSSAFGGKKCCFYLTSDLALVELIQE
jgi:hypothetical protein